VAEVLVVVVAFLRDGEVLVDVELVVEVVRDVIPVAVVVVEDGVVVVVVLDEAEVVVVVDSNREMKDHQQKSLKRGMLYMIVNPNSSVVGM
jgi:hypothetical protein